MYLWNWKKLWILLCIVPFLTACPVQPKLSLSVSQAAPGSSVIAKLTNLDGTNANVKVAGIAAEVTDRSSDAVTFIIPEAAPEGTQDVVIVSGDKIASGSITILSKSAPRFTLNPTQASPGDDVTATLSNLDGTAATVNVGGKEATVKSRVGSSLVFTVPAVSAGVQEVVIRSGEAEAKGSLNIVIVPGTLALNRKEAARGETVTATTTEVDLANATLFVAGQEVAKTVTGNTFTFKIPDNAPAGPQTVTLRTQGGNLNQSLGVLGDVVADKLTILLNPADFGKLNEVLGRLGFRLEQFRPLGGEGPCANALAEINVNGKPLGQAIEELEKEDVALQIDPRSGWRAGSVDHLSAISASIARNNGYTGKASTIAVLDTGVSFTDPATSELAGRLLPGFNAVTDANNDGQVDPTYDENDVIDKFDDPNQPGTNEGHGTPIAVLAAGTISGVAPGAEILPVKTCTDEGVCYSSDVIVGMCHALTAEKASLDKLVLNLSFGGDTPVDALQAVMEYALEKGVQIAAAAGNEGDPKQFKAPQLNAVHYPAAFNLPGLVAVGALEANSLQCVDFSGQKVNNSYGIQDNAFTSNGVAVSFKEFLLAPNQPAKGSATIIDRNFSSSGIVNEAVQLSDINASFAFAYPLEGLTLYYSNDSSVNNLEVNGEQVIVPIGSLNNTSVAGVSIKVGDNSLELSGPISSFSVGGNFFVLDDLCPRKSSAWQPAVFSTRGKYVDIAAPGAGLRSGTPGNGYANAYQGTSFSTPLVAGAMALWKEADATLTPAQIEANLKNNAIPLPPFSTDEVGAGLLNLNVAPFNVPPVKLTAGTQ